MSSDEKDQDDGYDDEPLQDVPRGGLPHGRLHGLGNLPPEESGPREALKAFENLEFLHTRDGPSPPDSL